MKNPTILSIPAPECHADARCGRFLSSRLRYSLCVYFLIMCGCTTEDICRDLKLSHERLELVRQGFKTEKRHFRLAPVRQEQDRGFGELWLTEQIAVSSCVGQHKN